MRVMLGTAVNCAAIVIGGVAGLSGGGRMTARHQSQFKVGLGVAAVYVGLRMVWGSLNGGFGQVLRELCVILVGLMIGKTAGKMLFLQRGSNRLGRYAREEMEKAETREEGVARAPGTGLKVCAALFCVAPLAFLGPLQEALEDNPYPLLVKSVLDGLAAFAFAGMFGWGVLLSVIPVAAVQGTVWMAGRGLEGYLRAHDLIGPVTGVSGFLVFCAGLIILEIRRIEVAAYLPALAAAPLVARWFG